VFMIAEHQLETTLIDNKARQAIRRAPSGGEILCPGRSIAHFAAIPDNF
jgi:hypothetical protein